MHALIEFLYPVIGINAYHLIRKYPRILMMEIGVDGANGLFSIAFAVVEIESRFFFE